MFTLPPRAPAVPTPRIADTPQSPLVKQQAWLPSRLQPVCYSFYRSQRNSTPGRAGPRQTSGMRGRDPSSLVRWLAGQLSRRREPPRRRERAPAARKASRGPACAGYAGPAGAPQIPTKGRQAHSLLGAQGRAEWPPEGCVLFRNRKIMIPWSNAFSVRNPLLPCRPFPSLPLLPTPRTAFLLV